MSKDTYKWEGKKEVTEHRKTEWRSTEVEKKEYKENKKQKKESSEQEVNKSKQQLTGLEKWLKEYNKTEERKKELEKKIIKYFKEKWKNIENEVKKDTETENKVKKENEEEPKKKHRKWREKYKKALKEKGILLTNKERENIVKHHEKKEFKRFYKERQRAIKKDKINKFIKKWENKGFDDLLEQLSKEDKKEKKKEKKEKKSSHKHRKHSNKTIDNSSSSSGWSSESTDNSSNSSGWSSDLIDNYSSSNNESSSITSAEVWEAANIPKNERMKRLFPEWIPQNKEEMQKYLTKIEVPVRTPDWQEDKLKLNIHSKLASEYEAIFKEMYDKNIPVNPKKTWWFCWRKMRKWNKMSHHSYWSAVDVNYNVNGWVYGKTDKSSPYFNGKETVAIRKKHWFYRWWDRSSNYNDPMHFTYMNA